MKKPISFPSLLKTLITLFIVGCGFHSYSQFPQFPPNMVLDTANKDLVKLVNSERGTIIRNEETTINIVAGDVVFEHNGNFLYADSARLNLNTNSVNAYGNVNVTQADGTTAYADRLFYNGKTGVVDLYKNVELSSAGDYLWSDKVIYNLKTQIGSYTNNGTLQSGNTVVSSRDAVYNVKTKDARFKKNVIVIDPEYEVYSEDLNYNTDTRLVTFYAPSTIQNDSTTLYTNSGTYDAANEVATFAKRATIVTEGQYMTADNMKYSRKTGLGVGKGNVVAIDSTRNITMWGEFGTVNELTKQVMVTQYPIVKIVKDSTSMYLIADTFYSEPINVLYKFKKRNFTAEDSILLIYDLLQRAANEEKLADTNEVKRLNSKWINNNTDTTLSAFNTDTLLQTFDNIDSLKDIKTENSAQKNYRIQDGELPEISITDSVSKNEMNITNDIMASIDTTKQIENVGISDSVLTFSNQPILAGTSSEAMARRDSSEVRYIVAYRNVLMYSDSAQAKCDSLSYSQLDSLMNLYYNPVIWTRASQLTGNVITALIDSNNIKWVHVPQNGIMINESFPEKNDVMYDQLQGNDLKAFFSNNEIEKVIAQGSSSTIYYAKDEGEALIGISTASANDIHIRFGLDSTGNRQIKEILYYQDFDQTMHPLSKINPEDMKLPRFKWREEERPKTLEVFLKIAKDRNPNMQDIPSILEDKKGNANAQSKSKQKKSRKR